MTTTDRWSHWRYVRVSLVAMILVVGLVVAVLSLIQTNANQAAFNAKQADTNRRLANAIAQVNEERNARRAQIDGQIRQLACFIVSQTPNNPKQPAIRIFRARYKCPPYSKKNARRALHQLVPPTPRSLPTTSPRPRPKGRGRQRGHHGHGHQPRRP